MQESHALAYGERAEAGTIPGMPKPKLGPSVSNADALGLDHMRAFLAVLETGSQVRAAKQLGIAQATVCRHVERVQEHFGGGLFEAGGSGRLSARGVLVEQSVRASLAELERTRERLALEGPVLRIGFIPIVRPLVEQALRRLGRVHGIPTFDVRLLELSSEQQARALVQRELDIAISYALPELAAREGIEQTLVSEQPYVLAVPERACPRGKLARDVLATLTYVDVSRRSSQRVFDAQERWLKEHGVAPARRVTCPHGSELLAYAASGYGYGFLPALWTTASHGGIAFVPLPPSAVTVRIAAYSLAHVAPWMARLREHLSAAARVGLEELSRGA
jgi:DNA-binding transcriptional LysR family regulator